MIISKKRMKQVYCDVVFSVGPIELFKGAHTRTCVKNYFRTVKSDCLMPVIFPLPTFLFRVIHRAAEVLGIWVFPDECPLSVDWVTSASELHCRLSHRSVDRKARLTQSYVLYQQNSFLTCKHKIESNDV